MRKSGVPLALLLSTVMRSSPLMLMSAVIGGSAEIRSTAPWSPTAKSMPPEPSALHAAIAIRKVKGCGSACDGGGGVRPSASVVTVYVGTIRSSRTSNARILRFLRLLVSGGGTEPAANGVEHGGCSSEG